MREKQLRYHLIDHEGNQKVRNHPSHCSKDIPFLSFCLLPIQQHEKAAQIQAQLYGNHTLIDAKGYHHKRQGKQECQPALFPQSQHQMPVRNHQKQDPQRHLKGLILKEKLFHIGGVYQKEQHEYQKRRRLQALVQRVKEIGSPHPRQP